MESGLKGYQVEPWFGVVAPAGVPREIGEAHRIPDLPGFVKQGLAQFAIAEAATKALHALALGVGIAFGDAPNALGGDIACDVRLHLHKDEAARFFFRRDSIQFQNRVPCSAGASEGIEYKIAGIGCDLHNSFDKSRRLLGVMNTDSESVKFMIWTNSFLAS